jgi:pyruvate kinase
MTLPLHKTKIVCTIGPASHSLEVLEEMIVAGMSIARINLSHGDFEYHRKIIGNIRKASQNTARRVAIMADLPGPKIRIGRIANEPAELAVGSYFTLTTEGIIGDAERVSVSFTRLPDVVKKGDILFLNEGLIRLEVVHVESKDVRCRVLVGGEVRSRKGLNIPGIDLGISAFTDYDRECLSFALENSVDAVSQSFIENAADVDMVRNAAADLGCEPFIIGKIERSRALDTLDGILRSADGIMVARGDLGIEIPIEQIAFVQKQIVKKANFFGRPVIIATQMLESMTEHPLPTRAESTDVANAILDGTDCVMLSGESAVGKYPVEAVSMLAKIAAIAEKERPPCRIEELLKESGTFDITDVRDLLVLGVEAILKHTRPSALIVPTHSGATARSMARFKLPIWITAISSLKETCQQLLFSYGVCPVHEPDHPYDWRTFIGNWLSSHALPVDFAVLTEGPSSRYPHANYRIELIDLLNRRK